MRISRRTSVAAILLTATFTAGCGGEGSGDDAATGTAAPSPSTSAAGENPAVPTADPSASETAATYDTTFDVATPTIAKDVVEKFGEGDVEAATAAVVAVIKKWAYNAEALALKTGENPELPLSAVSDMDPATAADWTKIVNQFISENAGGVEPSRSADLYSWTLYGAFTQPAEDGSVTVPQSENSIVNPRISKIDVTSEQNGRLLFAVKSSARLRFIKAGTPKTAILNRTTKYFMSSTEEGWKVSGWTGQFQLGDSRLDS